MDCTIVGHVHVTKIKNFIAQSDNLENGGLV